MGWFALFDEFAVTVVDENARRGRCGSNGAKARSQCRDVERTARRVAARTLNEHRANRFRRQRAASTALQNRCRRRGASGNFAVRNALRARAMRRFADRVAQRVVRRAGNREQRLSRAAARGERRNDRVRSAHDRETREGALRARTRAPAAIRSARARRRRNRIRSNRSDRFRTIALVKTPAAR